MKLRVNCSACFKKDGKKFNLICNNKEIKNVKKNIAGHLFIKGDGKRVEEAPATLTDRGWMQYNVPVDLSKPYHIAYLSRSEEKVYEWEKSDPKEGEAYRKLLSALDRDGASGANPNKFCNESLRAALEKACTDNQQLVPVYYFKVNEKGKDSKTGNEERKEIVYMSGSAAVFKLPKDIKEKDSVVVKVTSEKDGKKYCQYIKRAE